MDIKAGHSATGANDQLFRVLIAISVDGIMVVDAKGIVQAYNPACERLFGYTADEVIGQDIRMLTPQSYRAEHEDCLSHYRDTGEKPVIDAGREMVGQRKDLSTFPMYLSMGAGELDGKEIFVAIIHDLTAIKAETAQRGDADRLLAQIVQSSDDAILSKTLDGIIMSWNGAAERIFGYSSAEAIGQPISILIPPALLEEEARILAKSRAGKSIRNYETVRRHKDGSDVYVMLTVAPVRDAAGRIIGASKIARDITAQKQAEARTLALRAELAHVARLSAMGQMSAAIAHELNQPLTAIMNYVRAAQRLLEPDDVTPERMQTARGAMDKAAGQTARAGSIIRYLREFAEKRVSEKRLENLNTVIEEAVALAFVGAAQSDVKVRLALNPHIPAVVMDKVQIQQVLVNLVRNSIEAMAEAPLRELTVSSDGNGTEFVFVTIRDTGSGLSPEVLKKLFQPFVTTKEKGMGIGLNICQSLVEAHGGRIRVLPDVNPGAAFEIRLPCAPAPDERQTDDPDQIES